MFGRMPSLVVLSLALGACASSSTVGSSSGASSTRGSRDVITTEELAASSATNALDAVRQLRPTFLQSRGPVSLGLAASGSLEPAVFLDGQRFGTLGDLASIPINDIREIRHLSGPDATQRFGTGYASGAILVVRKTGTPR